jgi:hypothetical protein
MQQQDRGGFGSTGLAIEDLETVDIDCAVFDGSHGALCSCIVAW